MGNWGWHWKITCTHHTVSKRLNEEALCNTHAWVWAKKVPSFITLWQSWDSNPLLVILRLRFFALYAYPWIHCTSSKKENSLSHFGCSFQANPSRRIIILFPGTLCCVWRRLQNRHSIIICWIHEYKWMRQMLWSWLPPSVLFYS